MWCPAPRNGEVEGEEGKDDSKPLPELWETQDRGI